MSGALLLLSSIAIDDGPVHSYNYSSTTSYGVVETFDGDHFYLMKNDRIQLEGYYCVGERSCGAFYFDTGYRTPKQDRDPQLVVAPIFATPLSGEWTLEIEPKIEVGGQIRNRPCVDSIGRYFHCYYGTQPSSPLFFNSFDEINEMFRQPIIRISEIEVRLTWVF